MYVFYLMEKGQYHAVGIAQQGYGILKPVRKSNSLNIWIHKILKILLLVLPCRFGTWVFRKMVRPWSAVYEMGKFAYTMWSPGKEHKL